MKKLFIGLVTILSLSSSFASQELFGFCNSMSFSDDKNSCLRVIKDGTFQTDMVKKCRAMTFADDQIDCLKSIKNNYYQAEGVNFCSRMTFADDKQDCYNTIKNKTIHTGFLNSCMQMTFADDQMSCLKQNAITGEYYNNTMTAEETLQMIGEIALRIRRDLERGNYRRALGGIIRIIDLTSY